MEDNNRLMGQRELHERVLSEGLCTGCGACVNLCPYLESYRDQVRKNTAEMFRISKEEGILPLDAAMKMAKERVIMAMKAKRLPKE